jgi:hypothetical protein
MTTQPGRPDQYRSAQGGDFRAGGYPPSQQQYQQGPPPQQAAPPPYQTHPLQQQQVQVMHEFNISISQLPQRSLKSHYYHHILES